MQIKSITLRLFLSECLVLIAFFTAMLFTFDYVVIEGLAKDRLLNFMSGLESDVRIAITNADKDVLPMPYHFQEGRLGDKSADLYGFVYRNQKQIWQSPWVDKEAQAVLLPDNLQTDQTVFLRDDSRKSKRRYVLFKNLRLKNAQGEESDYMLMVSEGDIFASIQLNKLKDSLKESVSLLGLVTVTF